MTAATSDGTNPKSFMVVGPTGSGKTGLLCSLQHASTRWRGKDGPVRSVKIVPLTDETTALFHDGRDAMIKYGRLESKIGATETLANYKFHVVVETPWSMLFGATTVEFNVWDGKGAELVPSASERDSSRPATLTSSKREEYFHSLATASGIVLCVDVSDADRAAEAFYSNLPTLLAGLARNENALERIVVLLSKCDQYGVHNATPARRVVDAANPVAAASRVMTRGAVQALVDFADSGKEDRKVAFGFASSYGFIAANGAPNFDAASRGLKTHRSGAIADNERYWAPFRVLDPFVYLATGRKCGLTLHQANESIPDHELDQEPIEDTDE